MRTTRLRSPFCIVSTGTTSAMGWGVMQDDLGGPQGLFMVREHISRGISPRLRSVLCTRTGYISLECVSSDQPGFQALAVASFIDELL